MRCTRVCGYCLPGHISQQELYDPFLRRGLHGLILVTASSRGKVADVDIIILLQLLQAGYNP